MQTRSAEAAAAALGLLSIPFTFVLLGGDVPEGTSFLLVYGTRIALLIVWFLSVGVILGALAPASRVLTWLLILPSSGAILVFLLLGALASNPAAVGASGLAAIILPGQAGVRTGRHFARTSARRRIAILLGILGVAVLVALLIRPLPW